MQRSLAHTARHLLPGLLLLSLAQGAYAQTAIGSKPYQTNINARIALKIQPGVTLAQIRALPPNATVETRSGRRVSAAQFNATGEALKALAKQAPKLRSMDLNLSRTNAPAQLQWQGPQQLTELRKLQPSTVIQLRDGRKLTAADINKLQELSARTGLREKLAARAQARGGEAQLRGEPALIVRSAEDLRKVERLPDGAIVATADGKRTTAGDIRTVLAQRRSQTSGGLR